MPCSCGKPGRVKLSYTQLTYCKNCFLRLIQHRAQKELRQKAYFKGKDRAAILKDQGKEYFIANWLFEQIFENRLQLRAVKSFGNVRGKKILPSSLDREIKRRLDPFITGKPSPDEKLLRFPTSLLEEEVIQTCKLIGYKKIKKDPPHPLIDPLEKRSPGTKFALYQSFQEIDSS